MTKINGKKKLAMKSMWVAHITSHEWAVSHNTTLTHTHIPTHTCYLAMSCNRASDLAWPGHGFPFWTIAGRLSLGAAALEGGRAGDSSLPV